MYTTIVQNYNMKKHTFISWVLCMSFKLVVCHFLYLSFIIISHKTILLVSFTACIYIPDLHLDSFSYFPLPYIPSLAVALYDLFTCPTCFRAGFLCLSLLFFFVLEQMIQAQAYVKTFCFVFFIFL